MPGIREKPKMKKPKELDRKAAMPKDIGRMAREQFKQTQEPERTDNPRPVREATDDVEQGAERVLHGVSNTAHKTAKRIKHRKAERIKDKQRERPGEPQGGAGGGDAPPGNHAQEPPHPTERVSVSGDKPHAEYDGHAQEPPRSATRPSTPQGKPLDIAGTPDHAERSNPVERPTTRHKSTRKTAARTQPKRGTAQTNTPTSPRRNAPLAEHRPQGHFRQRALRDTGGTTAKGTAKKATKVLPRTKPSGIVPRPGRKAQKQVKTQVVQQTKKAAKVVTQNLIKAAQAAIRAVVSLLSTIAGVIGGGTLLVIVLVIIVIAAIASSPFGIFFSSEPATVDSVPLSVAVARINTELTAEMDAKQNEQAYDDIIIHGNMPDWVEVAAVFACKVAGAEMDAADVATIDADRIDRLTAVMRDMSRISYAVSTIHHPGETEDEPDWTEYILHIYINSMDADGAATLYGFTTHQREALAELLSYRVELASIIGDLSITDQTALDLLANLSPELTPERRAAVKHALSLVGKVNYFWGGKSYVQGWDSAWGTLRRVTADGSSTTGTYRPYGLDCTGYLSWAFLNTGIANSGNWHIGGNTTAITWSTAQPGDLVFNADESHVGLVVGRDSGGNIMVAHCASSANNVVITKASESGFVAVGVPQIYGE